MLSKSLICAAAFIVALAPAAGAVTAGPRVLTATLSGTKVVPGPGDGDAAALVTVTLRLSARQICYDVNDATGLAPITAIHIHRGTADRSGPPVVTLLSGSQPLEGCAATTRGLMRSIQAHPERYYVQIHTTEFPDGALRGQLKQ